MEWLGCLEEPRAKGTREEGRLVEVSGGETREKGGSPGVHGTREPTKQGRKKREAPRGGLGWRELRRAAAIGGLGKETREGGGTIVDDQAFSPGLSLSRGERELRMAHPQR
ncbi:hypothetical protein CDL15_Pgr022136 [Punica granatum]|uniref:Uncharacterized protein n=1 Tax=Punica granatum TaxID=22663 RepID=A0A218VTQ1_PUNGR|nr:hypothetical protein CDL15_Pgr022136 [Punica granatum]PKI70669.1 hypothetical protein CRG98_008902 [Punica granatum]